MNSKIIEKNGSKYMIMPNGGLLKITQPSIDYLIATSNADIPNNASGVYMISCFVTGRKYIGSSNKLKNRIIMHVYCISKKLYTKNSLNSISIFEKGFYKIEVLECGFYDDKKLLELESYYINLHNSIYPNGCNKQDPITGKLFDGVSNDYSKKKGELYIKNKERKRIEKENIISELKRIEIKNSIIEKRRENKRIRIEEFKKLPLELY